MYRDLYISTSCHLKHAMLRLVFTSVIITDTQTRRNEDSINVEAYEKYIIQPSYSLILEVYQQKSNIENSSRVSEHPQNS